MSVASSNRRSAVRNAKGAPIKLCVPRIPFRKTWNSLGYGWWLDEKFTLQSPRTSWEAVGKRCCDNCDGSRAKNFYATFVYYSAGRKDFLDWTISATSLEAGSKVLNPLADSNARASIQFHLRLLARAPFLQTKVKVHEVSLSPGTKTCVTLYQLIEHHRINAEADLWKTNYWSIAPKVFCAIFNPVADPELNVHAYPEMVMQYEVVARWSAYTPYVRIEEETECCTPNAGP